MLFLSFIRMILTQDRRVKSRSSPRRGNERPMERKAKRLKHQRERARKELNI